MPRFAPRHFHFLIAGLFVVACGASSSAPATPVSVSKAEPVSETDATAPHMLEVDGDPNGLWWDTGAATLFLADAEGDRILSYTDAGGFAVFRELTAAAAPEGSSSEGRAADAAKPGTQRARTGLGQIVRMSDGSFVVTRLGFGKRGDVVVVPPEGEVRVVPGLDPTRRRIGLTLGPDGKLYDSWFAKQDSGRAGAMSELSRSGGESDLMTGLTKPVGVLTAGDQLFVSDQDLDQVLVARLATPEARKVFATFSHPDLLAAGPLGSFFAGSSDGNVYRISANGEVKLLHGGFGQVRGVAYDPDRHRLFVVDHGAESHELANKAAPQPVKHRLHILPVE